MATDWVSLLDCTQTSNFWRAYWFHGSNCVQPYEKLRDAEKKYQRFNNEVSFNMKPSQLRRLIGPCLRQSSLPRLARQLSCFLHNLNHKLWMANFSCRWWRVGGFGPLFWNLGQGPHRIDFPSTSREATSTYLLWNGPACLGVSYLKSWIQHLPLLSVHKHNQWTNQSTQGPDEESVLLFL